MPGMACARDPRPMWCTANKPRTYDQTTLHPHTLPRAGTRRRSVLFGMASKDDPLFQFELPDGWVGGYGPTAFVDALVDHARANPDEKDRAYELIGTAAGAEEHLFMAGAVRGPAAGLTVTADAMQPGRVLSLDDELDAWVEGNLEVLATDDGVAGDPIMSTVEQPYAGRELRWMSKLRRGTADGGHLVLLRDCRSCVDAQVRSVRSGDWIGTRTRRQLPSDRHVVPRDRTRDRGGCLRRKSHVGERSRAPEHSESGSYWDSS